MNINLSLRPPLCNFHSVRNHPNLTVSVIRLICTLCSNANIQALCYIYNTQWCHLITSRPAVFLIVGPFLVISSLLSFPELICYVGKPSLYLFSNSRQLCRTRTWKHKFCLSIYINDMSRIFHGLISFLGRACAIHYIHILLRIVALSASSCAACSLYTRMTSPLSSLSRFSKASSAVSTAARTHTRM